MEFRQLEAFINTVKYGSISRAADASFLSQPTLSTHIANLEKELGVTLLNRGGKTLSLTPHGERFYPYAVNLVNLREEAARTMIEPSDRLAGVLNICTSSIPGEYLLPGLLAEYHLRYPDVRIHVTQTDTKNTEGQIIDQLGEIGFVGMDGNPALDYMPVSEDEYAVLVPNRGKYREMENGSRIPFEEIMDEEFIVRDSSSGTEQELEHLKLGENPVFENLKIVMHANNMETIKKTVEAGFGVSIMSRCCVERFADGERTRYFLFSDLAVKRRFFLVCAKSAILSLQARAFRDLTSEKYPSPEQM